jgi:hypothetical protein
MIATLEDALYCIEADALDAPRAHARERAYGGRGVVCLSRSPLSYAPSSLPAEEAGIQ